MEMLLMAACISLFGVAVAALAFNAATNGQEREEMPHEEPVTVRAEEPAPARFFGDRLATPQPMHARVPVEALLLEIESHVRLEQAAAESFLAAPSSSLLHCRTMSRLAH